MLVLPEETDAAYKAKVNEAIAQLQAKYHKSASMTTLFSVNRKVLPL